MSPVESGAWLMFDLDATTREIITRFEQRYGYGPRQVIRQDGRWFAGPVSKNAKPLHGRFLAGGETAHHRF